MNIKQLKDKIKYLEEQNLINDDTEVIVVGEYSYGTTVRGYTCYPMFHADEDQIISKPQNVLALTVDNYLYEHEDVGYSDMWLDETDYKGFIEEVNNG